MPEASSDAPESDNETKVTDDKCINNKLGWRMSLNRGRTSRPDHCKSIKIFTNYSGMEFCRELLIFV